MMSRMLLKYHPRFSAEFLPYPSGIWLIIALLLVSLAPMGLLAQPITQAVRGMVIDRESHGVLEGVNVAVYISGKLLTGVQADAQGAYRIADVPVGRVTIEASYIGYQKVSLPNIPVTAAKEVIINIEMEAAATEMKEVHVTTGRRKGESINDMAQISARAFTIEEASRYAGSRGDPARMASNFAGVAGTDDSRNDIVVRGNSPFGVLWNLENVHIPNPSHFAIAGTTGGSVGILSSRTLANSDFLTGAFPAEYGNALAAVFDVRLKNGNDQHHEAAIQWGILGAEVFAEGPLSRKNKSSYIFNYRYSTLDLLVAIGANIGTKAIPHYQDLNFKLNFPLQHGGALSVFGIGGYSTINIITSTDKVPNTKEIYSTKDVDEFFRSGMGVIGVNYTRPINDRSYARITLAISAQGLSNHYIRIKRHIDSTSHQYVVDGKYDKMFFDFIEPKVSLNWYRNYKLSARHVLRYGLNSELLIFNYHDSILDETSYQWRKRLLYTGAHFMFQPYLQWRYAISSKVTLTAGLHGQLFTLNNSWSIEPRASIKYQFHKNQSIAFGAGLHSQVQPYYIYFQRDDPYHTENSALRNKDLGFTRAIHAILSYDVFLNQSVHIKAEGYFQYLFELPVDTFASSYCILNEGKSFDRFFPSRLTNKGVGRNVGIELTVEKFFTHHWFIMGTASLYDARYRASNGQWYNADFNGRYVVNLLGTKEFVWGRKRIHTFSIGGKVTVGGGQRYTPYDTIRSKYSEDAIVVDSLRNSYEFKPYFRLDIKLSYSINTRHHLTHEIGIDLVNLTAQKNILKLQYVDATTPAREVYQLGFLPLFYYRLDFGLSRHR